MADRVALVTGGSRGIGAAVARRLAHDGFDVALTYVRAAAEADAVAADIAAMGRGVVTIQADAAQPSTAAAAVDQTVQRFGRLDTLVNNAGIFPTGPLEQVTLDEIDRTLAVHVRAVFLTSQAAANHMTDGGRIISIGSSFAERVPYPGATLYAMSKAALMGLTRGLARDLGPRGITAVVVHPGSTDTDMNPSDGPGADAERTYIPLDRYAGPDEIAAVVALLAGEAGSYINGTAITVDGGFAA